MSKRRGHLPSPDRGVLPSRRAVLAAGVALAGTALPAVRPRAQQADPAPAAAARALMLTAKGLEVPVSEGFAPASRLAFNGTIPGPLLVANRGDTIDLTLANATDAPLDLRILGLRSIGGLAGIMDRAPVAQDAAGTLRFRVAEAGLLIYRATAGPLTVGLIERGLTGCIVVADPADPPADRDLVLAVEAVLVDVDGQLIVPGSPRPKDARRLTFANGQPQIRLQGRPRERLRLRIANIGVLSPLTLRCEGMEVRVVAFDSQPSEVFAPAEGVLVLPPGGRAEIFAELAAEGGTARILDLDSQGPPLLEVAVAGEALAPRGEPPRLGGSELAAEVPLAGAERVNLVLNPAGRTGRPEQPIARLTSGGTLVLTIDNKSAAAYVVHLEGHAARLLDGLDDGWKPWWQDSLLVTPGKPIRIALVAGAKGRWAIEAIALDAGIAAVDPVAAFFEVG